VSKDFASAEGENKDNEQDRNKQPRKGTLDDVTRGVREKVYRVLERIRQILQEGTEAFEERRYAHLNITNARAATRRIPTPENSGNAVVAGLFVTSPVIGSTN
jgi:hypothetical protein